MQHLRLSVIVFIISFLSINHKTHAQYKQQILFPNDSSFVLINELVQNFKPLQVLDYSQARVKMYQQIYNENDSVSCVYTKHTLYLSPASSDPIGYLSKNGNSNGINCEHTFPQSKGAETGNARSDMHHLFPSRAAVNEARSNYPFGEISDSKTDDWYYKSFSQTNKPSQFIDEYSESINGLFEPREDHKGNVARAIFYFFTMYELQADRSFFEGMKITLCDWHLKDPVDSLEWTRSQIIATYQSQKPNPFVLDCSLAKRSYCSTHNACQITTTSNSINTQNIDCHPNPFQDQIVIVFAEPSNLYEIILLDLFGNRIHQTSLSSHPNQSILHTENLPAGYYQLIIKDPRNNLFRKSLIKI